MSPELALIDPELARVSPVPIALVDDDVVDPPEERPAAVGTSFDELRRLLEVATDPTLSDRADDRGSSAGWALRRPARDSLAAVAVAALLVAAIIGIAATGWFGAGRSHSSAPRSASAVGATRTIARLAASRPHVFGWVAVRNASSYRVRFFRDGQLVFEATPAVPRIVLPSHWRFDGHAQSLVPGTYHWTVQPGFGRSGARTYGKTTVATDWVAAR